MRSCFKFLNVNLESKRNGLYDKYLQRKKVSQNPISNLPGKNLQKLDILVEIEQVHWERGDLIANQVQIDQTLQTAKSIFAQLLHVAFGDDP